MDPSDPMDLDGIGPDNLSDCESTESHTEPSWSQKDTLSQLPLRFKPDDIPPSASEANSQHAWDDPLRRASRWRDEDPCHTFYHNILKDLGLDTTRSREVANWRIKKRINEATKGGKPLPIQLPTHINTYTNEDVHKFVQEQPSGELRSRSAYDVVMTEWLAIRSPYTSPKSNLGDKSYEIREHSIPNAPSCDRCERKLRLCRCEACHGCGNLLSECLCNHCKTCNRYNSECTCTPRLKKITREKEEIPYRVRERMDVHKSSPRAHLALRRKGLTQQQCFTPEELCRTYIILTSAAVYDDLKRSGIAISFSSSNNSLYGRYRHTEDLHGLFRTNCVLASASTKPIPCVVAVENPVSKDGTWIFDVAPVGEPFRYPPSPLDHAGGIAVQQGHNCKGNTFLSSSLIVLGSHFLGHRIDLAPEDGPHVVFGVRVSDAHDDVDALKESWNAIHWSYCTWYGHEFVADGDDLPDAGDEGEDAGHWRGPGGEADGEVPGSEWDEKIIDELVNQLYRHE